MAATMLTGSRTLPLLCRKTQTFPADIVQMVRECLRLHVGTRCPPWLDGLFVQHLQGLGPDSEVIFTLCSSMRLDFTSRYNWTWMGTAGDDKQDTDVAVTLTLYPTGYNWTVDCAQDGVWLLQDSGMDLAYRTRPPSILNCLKHIRKCFVSPDTNARGTLQVPSCLHDWRAFFSASLFCKTPTPQATLRRWMHAAEAERCAMCKKPNAQRQRNAFCSFQCAEASATLSCRICRVGPPWYVADA